MPLTGAASRGKRKESRAVPAHWHGTIMAPIPKAASAAVSTDRMRSSAAVEHPRTQDPPCAEEGWNARKKKERKKETARWTLVPHVSE